MHSLLDVEPFYGYFLVSLTLREKEIKERVELQVIVRGTAGKLSCYTDLRACYSWTYEKWDRYSPQRFRTRNGTYCLFRLCYRGAYMWWVVDEGIISAAFMAGLISS